MLCTAVDSPAVPRRAARASFALALALVVAAAGCSSTMTPADASPDRVDVTGDASRPDAPGPNDAGLDAPGPGPDGATPDAPAPTDGGGAFLPRCVPVDPCGPSTGMTINVAAGGDLQAAIDRANPGDTIALAAGATFRGNFRLPNKTGTQCVTIRTATPDAMLPPRGRRVTPAQAPLLARIEAVGTEPAITTADSAHHYRLLGLEIAPQAGTYNYVLVLLGNAETQTTMAQVPHDLVLDHVYVHGDPMTGLKRGVELESASTLVVDSYIADCKGVGQDTQAIGGFNGPGPFQIINDYLEGAGENVLFGGADPRIPNLIPSDITVCHNHFFKPAGWHVGDPAYQGTHWSVKNVFELKNARRVYVAGNLLEQNWADGQVGFAVVLTPRNQDGTCPWCTVEDVTFEYNTVRRSNNAVNILGTDDTNPSGRLTGVTFRNNVFTEIGTAPWGDSGIFLQLLAGPVNVVLRHNTALQSGTLMALEGGPDTGFVFDDNIAPANMYGIHAPTGEGTAALTMLAPGFEFRRNIVPGAAMSRYPTDNFYPASLDAVGFVDRAGGDLRLAPTSMYRAMGTDGHDPGVDWAAFDMAQSARSP